MLRALRFLQLSHHERRLFFEAYVRLALVDLDLRWRRSNRVLEQPPELHAEETAVLILEGAARAEEYARWITAAARHHIVQARCLHQSLALHSWLKGDGIPSRLYVGVRKVDGEMQAHAWVTVGDKVLIDEPRLVSTFTPLRGALGASSNWFEYRGVQRKSVR